MEQPLAFEIPDLRLWVQTERKTNTFWFRDFLKRKNQYFDFINKHKNLISMNEIRDSSLIYHIHHIVPKFLLTTTEELNFMDSNENTILLSRENHVIAHQLFAKLYDDPRATGAIALLLGETPVPLITEWRRQGAYASHKVQKAAGKSMWDSTIQKKRADKSMAKPDALESRSRGGKIAGKKRHLGVAIQKSDRYMFSYKNEELLGIINCETGGQVLEELQRYIPETTIQRTSPLLSGKRKNASDWTCQKVDPLTNLLINPWDL